MVFIMIYISNNRPLDTVRILSPQGGDKNIATIFTKIKGIYRQLSGVKVGILTEFNQMMIFNNIKATSI